MQPCKTGDHSYSDASPNSECSLNVLILFFCWHAIQLVFLPPRSYWGGRVLYTVLSLFYDQCRWPHLPILLYWSSNVPPTVSVLLRTLQKQETKWLFWVKFTKYIFDQITARITINNNILLLLLCSVAENNLDPDWQNWV